MHCETRHILARLSGREQREILERSKAVDRIDLKWQRKISGYIEWRARQFIAAKRRGDDPPKFDVSDLLAEHAFEVMFLAWDEVPNNGKHRLAKPKTPTPRSLAELMKMYDRWRKDGVVPRGIGKQSTEIRDLYLKKLQEVWRRYGRDFIEGKEFNRDRIADKIIAATKAPAARARTIVQTETTRYYNQQRVLVYGENDGVTHLLFVAIRDSRTTKWCKTRNGMVMPIGTRFTRRNTPPCHWNCRSEVLPLSPANPVHLKLIAEASRKPENRTLEPLPRGWAA